MNDKKWIVMLYLAADNNLSEEGVWALTEIQDVVEQGKLKNDMGIVVLFDTNVRGRKTQVFEFGLEAPRAAPVKPMDFGGRLRGGEDVREWLENQDPKLNLEDANSPDLLTAFIKRTAQKYPEKNYALILSGHGAGAVGDFLGQGEDNVAGSDYKGMSIRTLGQAIGRANVNIDILGMDSCLMSMAEVCYELPSEVKLLVGSEGNGPLTGWPFKEILLKLKALEHPPEEENKKDLTALDIALIAQEEYIRYYSDYHVAGTSVDLAVCNLEKKDSLTDKLTVLAKNLKEAIKDNSRIRDQVILAHWRAQSYKGEQYTDLWDFCDLLQEDIDDSTIDKSCGDVKTAIQEIVVKCRYYGVRFQHSHGLSVYFPWKYSPELDAYRGGEGTRFTGLKLAEETEWGDFLIEYVYSTRREMRGLKREKSKCVMEHKNPETIEIVTSSGKTENVNLLNGKDFPPDSRDFPPDSRDFPPDSRDFPPDSRGALARLANMKNPPIGFLRKKKTGEEIYPV